jgi:hypothetical protein
VLPFILGALVVVALAVWLWARFHPTGTVHRRRCAPLGRFSVRAGEGASLAIDVRFDLHHERGVGLVGELCDRDQVARRALAAFPLRVGRVEVDVVRARGRGADLVAREIVADDEAFTRTAATGSEETQATPLVPADFGWEGVRLRGPRAVRWIEPRPRVMVVGFYMAGEAALAEAMPGDWAAASGPSPTLVIDDGGAPRRFSLARAHADHLALVDGLSISWATPRRPPPRHIDPDRREGGSFAANIGVYLERPETTRVVRVHAEVGPLRSDTVEICVEVE